MEMSQISIDLLLILRISGGAFWGILLAVFMQFSRRGKFLAAERTWLAVVIGVGVDLLIAYSADWWTIVFVIVGSSVGVIVRSLVNEHDQTEQLNSNSYKLKWALEDSAVLADEQVAGLDRLLGLDLPQAALGQVSEQLSRAHKLHAAIVAARKGNYLR